MPVVESHATVAAPPADVFAFLHDPAQRPVWDVAVDLCNLEGEDVVAGSRLHLRGRRKAPSWVGEYVEVATPRRSVLRLVDGVGMPFSDYRQVLEVTEDGGRDDRDAQARVRRPGAARPDRAVHRPREAGPRPARLGSEGRDAIRVTQPCSSSEP